MYSCLMLLRVVLYTSKNPLHRKFELHNSCFKRSYAYLVQKAYMLMRKVYVISIGEMHLMHPITEYQRSGKFLVN